MYNEESFEKLYKHLEKIDKNVISFTFKQLEKILGCELPTTALEQSSFWKEQISKHCEKYGFSVSSVDLKTGCVMFVRN